MNKNFFGIGKDYLKNGHKEEAFNAFEQGATLGDAKAIFGLAIMYYHGWWVEENIAHAQELFASCFDELNRLASENDGDAAYILYSCYDCLSNERFIEYDDEKALEYLELSAELGVPDGMFMLGVALRCGTLLPIEYDDVEALNLFEKCAALGMPEAMLEIGDYYFKTDSQKARKWYEKALEAGEEEAKERLEYLENGRDLWL